MAKYGREGKETPNQTPLGWANPNDSNEERRLKMTKEQYEALPLKGRIDALVHVIKSFSYFATATVLPLPEGGYSLS